MNSNIPYLKSFGFNTLKKSHGNGTSNTQTHGHLDYQTKSAQWADSVKIVFFLKIEQLISNIKYSIPLV